MRPVDLVSAATAGRNTHAANVAKEFTAAFRVYIAPWVLTNKERYTVWWVKEGKAAKIDMGRVLSLPWSLLLRGEQPPWLTRRKVGRVVTLKA